MSEHVPAADNFSEVTCLDPTLREIRREVDPDEAFWVGDLNRPRESLSLWETHLPNIKVFYAMKCCDEPHLLQFMADHHSGFDCASQPEISRILGLGVQPDRILFSHPIKSCAAIRYAKEQGIQRFVFDTTEELDKIIHQYHNAQVFLRVKPKFSNARIQLSKKFGAEPLDVSKILKHVKKVNANFIGFSFHVGSQCDDITTFRTALEYVSDLKREASEIGLSTRFIDIGGGFLPPNAPANHSFPSIASGIQRAIEELFNGDQIEFVAEPGRFISSEYLDLHLPVICAKEQRDEKDTIGQSIYIPDGIYGAFNAICYDHAMPHFQMRAEEADFTRTVPTVLWGQTCDSMDCLYENLQWPILTVGDLLSVRKFGAYTYSPTSFFNGFGHHKVFVVNEESNEKY